MILNTAPSGTQLNDSPTSKPTNSTIDHCQRPKAFFLVAQFSLTRRAIESDKILDQPGMRNDVQSIFRAISAAAAVNLLMANIAGQG
jgi:hypothetical protein